MSQRLTTLSKQLARVNGSIEVELRRLRRTCKHKSLVCCKRGTNGGYLFMCTRCFAEEHGWALVCFPYRPHGEIPEISRDQFFGRRPPGELHLLGEVTDE